MKKVKTNKKWQAMLLGMMLASSLCLQACGSKEEATPSDVSAEVTEAPGVTETVEVPEETPEETVETPEEATPVPTEAPVNAGPTELDFYSRMSVYGGDIGMDNADGSVTYEGGYTSKCAFPLWDVVSSNETLNVTVKLQFDSADDVAVRFYLTNDALENCTTEVYVLENCGSEPTEVSFQLTAAMDANAIMFASSSYDAYVQNVTLYSISVSNEAE